MGNYNEALADYSAAIDLEPKSYKFYAKRAALYKKLGEKLKSLRDYKTITGIFPSVGMQEDKMQEGERCYYQAMAYRELGDAKWAQTYFELAARDGYTASTVKESDDE